MRQFTCILKLTHSRAKLHFKVTRFTHLKASLLQINQHYLGVLIHLMKSEATIAQIHKTHSDFPKKVSFVETLSAQPTLC